jgi:hypothetical protein
MKPTRTRSGATASVYFVDRTESDFYRAGGGRRGDLAPRFSVGKVAHNSQLAP